MTVFEKYLTQDIINIKNHFYNGILDSDGNNIMPDITIEPNSDGKSGWIRIDNFPLPQNITINGEKHVYKNEFERVLIVLDNYPEMPPLGIHLQVNSPNVELFENVIFKDHWYDGIRIGSQNYREEVIKLKCYGWHWVCFHYNDNKWTFNRTNPLKGESLLKYLHALYARISGVDVANS